jgi:hypothetical protein
LQSHRDEVAAHFKLVINVFLNIPVSEKLQYLLLVFLNLVDNWDEEQQAEKD